MLVDKIPTLALGYDRVQVLALAPHELTTNAVKLGALKQNGGRLDIRWSVDGSARGFPLLVLVWQKSGVPCRQTFPAVATAELNRAGTRLYHAGKASAELRRRWRGRR